MLLNASPTTVLALNLILKKTRCNAGSSRSLPDSPPAECKTAVAAIR